MRQQSCNFVTDGVLSKLSSARAKYNNTTAIYGTRTANYIPLLIHRNTSKRISRDFTAVATVAFSFFQAQVRLGNPSLEVAATTSWLVSPIYTSLLPPFHFDVFGFSL